MNKQTKLAQRKKYLFVEFYSFRSKYANFLRKLDYRHVTPT